MGTYIFIFYTPATSNFISVFAEHLTADGVNPIVYIDYKELNKPEVVV